MIIKNSKYVIGATYNNLPKEEYKEIILSGRSNVGKSSFINTLLNRKNLARISSNPGKTRVLNYFLVNDSFYLVDVPGYGFANRSDYEQKEFGKMMESYFETRTTLVLAILLVDLRHKPTNDDILMYNYIKHYCNNILVVATKLDKVKKNDINKNINLIKSTLNHNDVILPISSLNNEGIEEVRNFIGNYVS